MRKLTSTKLLLAGGFLVAWSPALAQGEAAQERTKGYHDHAAVVAKLTEWQKAHPAISTLEEIGRSAGGKAIHVIKIAAEGDTPADKRQGVFVGANMAGWHNAGAEAALGFIEYLLTSDDAAAMRRDRVVYVAPILNPDAHDEFFGAARRPVRGNANKIDRDNDGLLGEDGPNDLNGDGVISQMRIKDPTGPMIPDPDNPYEMKRADPTKGETGAYVVTTEGGDDDGDGKRNEDAADGAQPDRNFAHAFEYGKAEAGMWAGLQPESKAVMDFLLARRNIGVAVVFGPANNLLATPKSLGGAVDAGSQKFDVPQNVANALGLDPEGKYTIDEIWERAKTLPVVIQNNLSKDDVAQFLGVGPATKPTNDDVKMIGHYAEKYKERLKEAGLDEKRAGRQYRAGGFTPWLYYQYGAFALELDVWGVPKAPKKDDGKKAEDDKLTLEKLEGMSADDFLALGEEKIGAFMKEMKVPPQFSPKMVMDRVSSGQLSPKQMAGMIKQMGGSSGGGSGDKKGGPSDMAAFVEAHAPWAKIEWTPVTLPGGVQAEVGGYDPLVSRNPPRALLDKAIEVHTQTVVELSEGMARIEILKTEVKKLGSDVFRVKVTVGNTGLLATHTGLARKAKTHLPVRLGLELPAKAVRLHGPKWATSEQLAGKSGSLTGEWLVKAKAGSTIKAVALSDQAGSAQAEIKLEGGN